MSAAQKQKRGPTLTHAQKIARAIEAVGHHTPGPWRHSQTAEVIAVSGGYICVCGDADRNATKADRANAQLIAAAPLLLEACRAALPHHQGFHSETGDKLLNAITAACL
jgi:hypothetical protein